MQRSKNTDNERTPKPAGSWLAGVVIGTAIMSMAASAAVFGATLAVQDAALKKR